MSEQIKKVPETISQIWDGTPIPYGTKDTVSNGLVRQIQSQLIKQIPAEDRFTPDGEFGPTTANAIAQVLGIQLNDPTTLAIGPRVLTKLGFKKPEVLQLSTKVLAATIAGEGMGDKNDMKAIANVILNRSITRKIKPTAVALEPKQFSMWNQISGSDLESKTNNVIDTWGGGLKSAGNIQYWMYAIELAKQIEQKTLTDNTAGATHYFTGQRPYWANTKVGYIKHATIGSHEYGRDTSIAWAKNPVQR